MECRVEIEGLGARGAASQAGAGILHGVALRRHHPSAGRTASRGMRSVPNRGDTVQVDPREVGRVSQAVKVAQARHDR